MTIDSRLRFGKQGVSILTLETDSVLKRLAASSTSKPTRWPSPSKSIVMPDSMSLLLYGRIFLNCTYSASAS